MNDSGYLVKFKNFEQNPEGTGKLHYQILKEFGQVLWGQWSANGRLMGQNTYDRMNQETPFYLYALDKNCALLKMKVDRVLYKDEIINENLGYLIPAYYSIDTPCTNYYLISEIEILPALMAGKVIVKTSGRTADTANQINSTAPWNVYWDENNAPIEAPKASKPSSYMPPAPVSAPSPVINDNNLLNNYSVYCYTSRTTGKEYIGMTNDLARRTKEHSNPANWQREKKKFLYTMFTMLGYDDFELTILHNGLTEEEAHYWEAKEIENHNCYYPNGLNERDESRYLSKKS